MQTYNYGWSLWWLALSPAVGLGIWIWLSPTARRLLSTIDPRRGGERRWVRLRLRGRSAADYQQRMTRVAARRPGYATDSPPRHVTPSS